MAECEKIDFSQVPIMALKPKTRNAISQMLNAPKVIPSPSGLPRDWRGLAHVANLYLPFAHSPDPTSTILEKWENSTFADLLEAFKELDRWDVLHDNFSSIENDAIAYLTTDGCKQNILATNVDLDKNILTVDDIRLSQKGMNPQNYDAFLLYSEADSEFAMEIVNKLENEYELKLCLKDRDLVGGITFEHEAIMRLISERCNRLIIVVSPSFLDSPANKFFVTFAQALGIEQRQRKIIPCIYKTFPLPPQLSYYFVLNYTRKSQLWNFWDKLSQSVITPLPRVTCLTNTLGSVQIKEYTSCENNVELQIERAEMWECPKKSTPVANCIKFESTDLSKQKTKEESVEKVMNLTVSPSEASPAVSKSPTLSLFKKLLPKSPTGKTRSKTWFKKKKKKVAVTS